MKKKTRLPKNKEGNEIKFDIKKIDYKQNYETQVKLRRDLKGNKTIPNQRRAVDRLKILRLG